MAPHGARSKHSSPGMDDARLALLSPVIRITRIKMPASRDASGPIRNRFAVFKSQHSVLPARLPAADWLLKHAFLEDA
jgi:hypothetical protein